MAMVLSKIQVSNPVSHCDCAVSVIRCPSSIVNFLACVHSRGHTFSMIIMKLGQNDCLDKISDDFENGSCWIKKLVTK